MTTLLVRTRHDGPLEAAPPPAALLAPPAVPAAPPASPAGLAHTFADLLRYSRAEVLPTKAPTTHYQQNRFLAALERQYGPLPLPTITPAWLRSWRDQLSRRLKPDSVRQYLDVVSAVLTVAVNELEWLPAHPMTGGKVRKPRASRGRVRFLSPDEQARLLAACRASHKPGLSPLVLLALTTGARRGELFALRWQDVDLEREVMRLEETKNKEPRAVPVPSVTREVLRRWRQDAPSGAFVFPRQGTRMAFPSEYAWQAALLRAGLSGDFHFHDLRHSAASFLGMAGASLIEIAGILGHKTLQMVRRYTHFTHGHTHAVVERMAAQFVVVQPQEGATDDGTFRH